MPGSWTGRAPKMEVINGITVPPEPAVAANNATVVGVDVNNNGVRDDVERLIAGKVDNASNFSIGLTIAKSYQRVVTAGAPLSKDALDNVYGAVLCASRKQISQGSKPIVSDVQSAVLNTQARINAFKSATANYNGYFSDDLPACN